MVRLDPIDPQTATLPQRPGSPERPVSALFRPCAARGLAPGAAVVLVILAFLAAGSAPARAGVETIDATVMTLGYMNVYNLPADGGAYLFGSPWGINDLCATFSNGGSTVTFTPNTIGDPNPFWYTPGGGPGATGNKIMEANLYAEPTPGLYNGQTITFVGNVSSYTLADEYNFMAFVSDYAPDYSSVVTQSVPITSTGDFAVILATINNPARHVQWGLQMTGPDVWITDVDAKGHVIVNAGSGSVPEPSALALLAISALGSLVSRRRRQK